MAVLTCRAPLGLHNHLEKVADLTRHDGERPNLSEVLRAAVDRWTAAPVDLGPYLSQIGASKRSVTESAVTGAAFEPFARAAIEEAAARLGVSKSRALLAIIAAGLHMDGRPFLPYTPKAAA